jgi:hypothetical protein
MNTTEIHVLYSYRWGEHLFVKLADVIPIVWSSKQAQARALHLFKSEFFIPFGDFKRYGGHLNHCVPLKHLQVIMGNLCSNDPIFHDELIKADIPRFVQHVRKMFRMTLAKKLEQSNPDEAYIFHGKECLEALDSGTIL